MIKLGLLQSNDIFLLWNWLVMDICWFILLVQGLPLTKLSSRGSHRHFTWDQCKPLHFSFPRFANVQLCKPAYPCIKELGENPQEAWLFICLFDQQVVTEEIHGRVTGKKKRHIPPDACG